MSDKPSNPTYAPNPYTPNLSGLTPGKPVAIGGIGVLVAYTLSVLREFGVPLTQGQQEALETWVTHVEIAVLPLLTFWLMKRHFHGTAVDLLHQPPPEPVVIITDPDRPSTS